MKEYNNQTMPWKLVLIHKKYGDKYTYYKSGTDYLAYDEEKFEETPTFDREIHQVQTMWTA